MKIAFLNVSGQMGGAETSLVELLAAVRAAEPAWKLVLLVGEDGPLRSWVERIGVEVRVVPFPRTLSRLGDAGSGRSSAVVGLLKASFAIAAYLWKLRLAIGAEKPNIIHATGFKMQVLSVWAGGRGIPVVWHIHDYVRSRPLMRRLLALHERGCAMAIVNSHSVGNDLRAVCREVKIATIYNAIDLDRFSSNGLTVDLDALCGLSPAMPGVARVGLVATFARWKGHSVFLRALAKALAVGSPIRGYVIGGPIYQTQGSQHSLGELKAEAALLGLEDRVGFTGFIEDSATAMRALDIVVHASTEAEPFGMVIIEAMACCKPVIASRAGGTREIFADEVDALSHEPGDADMLSQQIARLVGDRELRMRLGRAGRIRAEQQYNRRRLAGELIAVYHELTALRSDKATLSHPNPGPVEIQ
jgi:glycosyltransferase involved in cell wall biosynthesis